MVRLPLIFFLFFPFLIVGQHCDCYQQLLATPDTLLLQHNPWYRQQVVAYQDLAPHIEALLAERDQIYSVLQASSPKIIAKDSLHRFFSCESYFIEALLSPNLSPLLKDISPLQKLRTKAKEIFPPNPLLPYWSQHICKFPNPFQYYDISTPELALAAFRQELAFYDLHAGERIADIGAGYGYFEQFLIKHLDSLEVQFNELNAAEVSAVHTQLSLQNRLVGKQHRFIPIVGSATQAKLIAPVDKVLMRNSFHHFYFPDEMLEDIKQALAEQGKIFVVDILRYETKKPPECPEHLPRSLFLAAFRNHGFELLRTQKIQHSDFQLFEFGLAQEP